MGKKRKNKAAAKNTTNYPTIVFGAYVLFYLIYFSKVLFAAEPSVFFGSDFILGVYYTMGIIQDALSSGQLPLMNPYVHGGEVILEEAAAMPFYPATWLSLIFSVRWAANLAILLHFILGSHFMFLLAHHLFSKYGYNEFSGRVKDVELVRTLTSAALGLAFMLSAFSVMRIYAGHLSLLATAIWLPLIILFLDKAADELKAWPFYAGAVALMGLAGHPQLWYFELLFASAYALILLINSEKRLRFLLFFVGSTVVGIGAFAVQAIPVIAYAGGDSARGLTAAYDYATSFSAPFKSLLTLFSPEAMGYAPNTKGLGGEDVYWWSRTAFFGTVPLLTAIYTMLKPEKKLIHYMLLGLCVLSLLLALGNNTFIYRIFYTVLPGFKSFRVPGRFFYLLMFCMLMLSALGAGYMLSAGRKTHLYALGILVILALVGLGAAHSHKPLQLNSFFVSLMFALALTALLIFFNSPGKKVFLAGALLVLVAAEMGSFSYKYFIAYPEKQLSLERGAVQAIKNDKNSQPFRILTINHNRELNISKHIKDGLQNINGYYNVNIWFNQFYFASLGKVGNFTGNMVISSEDQNERLLLLAKNLNVKYIISGRALGPDWGAELEQIYSGRLFVYRLKTTMPRAYLSYSVTQSSDEQALQTLRQSPFSFAASTLALQPASMQPGQGQVAVQSYRPGQIEITAETDANAMLVLSEAFAANWQARLNEKEQQIYRVNHAFMAVKVPPGKHSITFTYGLPSFTSGLIITLVSLALIIGSGFMMRRHSSS